MAACGFAYENLVDTAVLADAGATPADMPPSRLLDPQPRHRARWLAPDPARAVFDLGASRTIDVFALAGTTLTADSVVTFTASATSPGASEVYSGPAAAGQTSQDWAGLVVHVLAAPISARYLGFSISDPAQAAIDIGRFIAGPLWRPARNWSYGAQRGRSDLGVRETNALTGAAFARPGPRPRTTQFTLAVLDQVEAEGDLDRMDRMAGAAGDVLWIPDTAQDALGLARQCVWGAFRAPGEALGTRASFRFTTRAFAMVERL